MWKQREPLQEEVSQMAQLRARYDLRPLVIHANYLINLATPETLLRQRSVEALVGEIRRGEALNAEYLVLHPGSYRDGSPEQGIRTLAASLHEAARNAPLKKVTILIENTCGQGKLLGGTFEEVRDILALLDGLPVACCVDTAHCFAAGMNVSSREGLDAALAALDQTVGLGRVPVIHANDSRSPLGSRRDRHEHIGKGGIGLEGFRRLVNHPALRSKTFILETPIETPGDDRRNLETICALRRNLARPARSARIRRRQIPVRFSARAPASEARP
jgi:deoxyribonuclease-4